MKGMIEGFFGFEIFDFVFLGGKENVRLDFHRLPGPVFDPPRREIRGMSVGSFSRTAAGNRA